MTFIWIVLFLLFVCLVFTVAEYGLQEMDKREAARRKLEQIAARHMNEGQRGKP